MANAAKRSLYKSLTWRIFPTATLVFTTLFMTKNVTAALTVGAIEFCLKFPLYYLHERAWGAYLKDKPEKNKISAIKTVVWRIFSILFTFVVAYVAFKMFNIAEDSQKEKAAITTAIDHTLRMILYYAHERLWAKYSPVDKMEQAKKED